MANEDLRGVVQFLRRITGTGCAPDLSDSQLLRRFLEQRDETAFTALVQRHGPLVLSVCRRILQNEHEAEDAFQATFLVLVRKARSIAKQQSVGSWLYGVAQRVARHAQGQDALRRSRERQVQPMPAPDSLHEVVCRDLRLVLDEEVLRLPDRCRAPFVLCYLEGHTNEEAARLLGCPKGTVLSRLARAREILRHRLTRRGLGLSAGLVATLLSQEAVSAAVPAMLVETTARAAVLVVNGQIISARVAALIEGVLKAMFLNKLKTAAVVFLAAVVVGSGATLLTYGALAAERPGPRAAAKDRISPPEEAALPAAAAEEKPQQVRKEDLRYGGKTFEHWQTELLIELKPELLADGLKAMGAFGANGYGEEAAKSIIELVKGYDIRSGAAGDRMVLLEAHNALEQIGLPAKPILVNAFRDPHRNTRLFAARELSGSSSKPATAVRALIEATKDEDAGVRSEALSALSGVPLVEPGFGLGGSRLRRDEDASNRPSRFNPNFQITPVAEVAIPALVAAAKDKDLKVRRYALRALGHSGVDTSSVITALVEALKDEDQQVRQTALQAIAELGPKAKQAVPGLIAAFKTTDAEERILVVQALGTIGPAAKEAIPVLETAVNDPDPRSRGAVAIALQKINR